MFLKITNKYVNFEIFVNFGYKISSFNPLNEVWTDIEPVQSAKGVFPSLQIA